MDKKKVSNILGAGTITGFIVAMFLLLNNGNVQGATPTTTFTNNAAGITEVVPMENYNQLQAQNDQLILDLQTMQSREQQFAQQISAANNAAAQQNNVRSHEEHEHDDD